MTTMPPFLHLCQFKRGRSPRSGELQEFRHEITGAHFHFESEHNENVFMVALRTVPTDSTGLPISSNTPRSAAVSDFLFGIPFYDVPAFAEHLYECVYQ